MRAEGLPLATLKHVDMAKGATVNITVPAGHRYYLSFFTMNYIADATVATRIVTVYVDHGTPESHFGKFDVTASQNLRWALGWNNAAYAAYLVLGTLLSHEIPLAAGDVFTVGISNAQAGDTWNGICRLWDVTIGT